LMAVKWAREQSLTKQEALKEIIGSSDFTLKKYNEFRDITLSDTLDWIIKDYFDYQKAELKENITVNDIINELKNGRVIIAPMNGQLLHNPNYTAPGPIHHMMVIRGYDSLKNIFITNDPGTRRGELYEYDTDIFFKAISDYPTGYHISASQIEKNIIVVEKQ
ncbi:MAG: C39 family peptidase, partial [bacterium]|nr:C39 family peptidase [bacterium]